MPDEVVKGFMDIGTNSVHILVVKYFQNSLGTVVFQDREITDLGRDLYRYGKISKETLDKCRLVTDRFTAAAINMGADEVRGFATCAAREAKNKTEILRALESDRMDLRIIQGQEEARLVELGVFGAEGPSERTLLIDIGGGSTEITLSEGKEKLFIDSLDIGSVRFSYGFHNDPAEPMSDDDYDLLRRRVGMTSYRAVHSISEMGFAKAVGSSGTMESLAELCAGERDGDSSYMTYKELRELMTRLRKMSIEERYDVPKLSRGRADIIIGGGAIAEALMSLFGIERIEISRFGLKEGMQTDYLLSTGERDFDVKRSSVLSLANRCHYDAEHAEEVRDKALMLFDIMRDLGIHRMNNEQRQMLEYACILHDVGEFINYIRHHVHSYTIISNSAMFGFDNEELESMAVMAKVHHRRFPDLRDKDLRNMRKKTAVSTLKCAMMLKMADILDRHRTRSVSDIKAEIKDDDMVLTLISADDIRMEIWSLESVAHDFRKVFGLGLKTGYKKP